MDKLRILWIDDCEGHEKNSCYPELTLPKQFQPFFQIVRKSSLLPSSAPTTPDFLNIARAYGCRAESARNVAELHAQLRQSQQQTVPTIIQVMESDFI